MRFVENLRMNGGSSTPSICDQQLVERQPAAHAAHMPPGMMKPLIRSRIARRAGG